MSKGFCVLLACFYSSLNISLFSGTKKDVPGSSTFSGLTLEFVTAPKSPNCLWMNCRKTQLPRPTPDLNWSLVEMGVAGGGSGYLGPPERLFFMSLELGVGDALGSNGDTWW